VRRLALPTFWIAGLVCVVLALLPSGTNAGTGGCGSAFLPKGYPFACFPVRNFVAGGVALTGIVALIAGRVVARSIAADDRRRGFVLSRPVTMASLIASALLVLAAGWSATVEIPVHMPPWPLPGPEPPWYAPSPGYSCTMLGSSAVTGLSRRACLEAISVRSVQVFSLLALGVMIAVAVVLSRRRPRRDLPQPLALVLLAKALVLLVVLATTWNTIIFSNPRDDPSASPAREAEVAASATLAALADRA